MHFRIPKKEFLFEYMPRETAFLLGQAVEFLPGQKETKAGGTVADLKGFGF